MQQELTVNQIKHGFIKGKSFALVSEKTGNLARIYGLNMNPTELGFRGKTILITEFGDILIKSDALLTVEEI